MNKIILSTALAALFAAPAFAQEAKDVQVQGFVGIGLSAGGGDLATVSYTDGSKSTIKAGGGAIFTAGLDTKLGKDFSLIASLSYHVDDSKAAKNGSASFSRWPVEVLAAYHLSPEWRLGAGARFVRSAKLGGSGYASGIDQGFEDTTSGVVELEYFSSPKTGFKFRVVNEKFKLKSSNASVNGTHFAATANYYF